MATQPREHFDIEEQRVRILRAIEEAEKFSAETQKYIAERTKLDSEAKFMPLATVFQGFIAFAAVLGAGAALAKLFF